MSGKCFTEKDRRVWIGFCSSWLGDVWLMYTGFSHMVNELSLEVKHMLMKFLWLEKEKRCRKCVVHFIGNKKFVTTKEVETSFLW